eukprot:TRINITY_DN80149_c0_g1_i1.p1 TRINITY_DN80149_c0_g1~~TRINITY_DN80149_c0_g1_i1.p1  ORF type:complete len:1005 (-),score=232.08 TRINITY_DN80149_c0_g1_i1:152-3166(-)
METMPGDPFAHSFPGRTRIWSPPRTGGRGNVSNAAEAPAGVQHIGQLRVACYTTEQQARLRVDVNGKPAAAPPLSLLQPATAGSFVSAAAATADAAAVLSGLSNRGSLQTMQQLQQQQMQQSGNSLRPSAASTPSAPIPGVPAAYHHSVPLPAFGYPWLGGQQGSRSTLHGMPSGLYSPHPQGDAATYAAAGYAALPSSMLSSSSKRAVPSASSARPTSCPVGASPASPGRTRTPARVVAPPPAPAPAAPALKCGTDALDAMAEFLQGVPQASVNGALNGADSVASGQELTRAASSLVEAAAMAHGVEASYWASDRHGDFALLASSKAEAQLNAAPAPQLLSLLRAAAGAGVSQVACDRHLVGMAVRSGDAAVDGVLVCAATPEALGDSAQLALLRSVTRFAALLLGERLDRLKQAQTVKYLLRLERFHEAEHKMAEAQTLNSYMELLQDSMSAIMDCELATLYLIDSARNEIWTPPKQTLPRGLALPIGQGLVGYVAQRARETKDFEASLHLTNDPKSCRLWRGEQGNRVVTRNILTLPICARRDGSLLGVLQLMNKRGDFNDADPRFLGTIMRSSIAVELERLLPSRIMVRAGMDCLNSKQEAGQSSAIVTDYYVTPREDVGGGIEDTLFRRQASADSSQNSPSRSSTCSPSHAELNRFRRHSAECMVLATDPAAGVDVDSWWIAYWDLGDVDGLRLLMQALHRFDSFANLSISLTSLSEFFAKVKKGYNPNPYHRFYHGLSTLHYSSKLAREAQLAGRLTHGDMFALLVGSLCHDLGHRGYNNQFEVVTRSELALRYNDSSPLENYHAARTFEIAFSGGEAQHANIFKDLSPEAYTAVRKCMIGCILATDMKVHGEHVTNARKMELPEEFDTSQAQLLAEVIMHVADIANPFMPPDISMYWGDRMAEEMTNQVAAEKLAGVPVTAFMDGLTTPLAKAKSSQGFADFVVFPLMEPLFALFPGWAEPKEWLAATRKRAADVIAAEAAAKDAAAAAAEASASSK